MFGKDQADGIIHLKLDTKDLKATQEALGHTNISITQQYLEELNIEAVGSLTAQVDI